MLTEIFDIYNEISSYLDLVSVYNLMLISKDDYSFAKKLFRERIKGISYIAYEVDGDTGGQYNQDGPLTNNRINFNWKGKYTYGSVFFRGTSINLYDTAGEFVNKSEVSFQRKLDDNNEIEPDDEYDENSELEQEIMYWNDYTSFRVGVFNELFERSFTCEPKTLYNLIQKFRNHTLTPAEDLYEFNFINGWHWLKIRDPKEIGNDRLKKLYANEYTGQCYLDLDPHNTQIIFIDDHDGFLKEIKLVEEIAKIHKVTFYWV